MKILKYIEFVLFLSILLTGKMRIGVTERGSLKKIFASGAYPVYSKVVHNAKPHLTCSEFTMHMQNQL